MARIGADSRKVRRPVDRRIRGRFGADLRYSEC